MDKAKNYVTDKISNVAKPEAEVTDVDFKKMGLSHAEYLSKVSVTNPYSQSIPILISNTPSKALTGRLHRGRYRTLDH